MKKLLLLIALTLIAATSFGQWWWGIDFDTPWYLDRIVRDTISNPNCIWHVGQPSKSVFTSAHSIPNAFLTDTLNPVPGNDTSIFYLKHVTSPIFSHVLVLHFSYAMDGDSTDIGIIEVSPDTGNTWINLLTEDTTYNFHWWTPKPILTGSTTGWQTFDCELMDADTILGSYPLPDTLLFRFTYITDSSSVPHDGWMIDDINLEDWIEGIQEIQNDNLISISPNPASDELKIHRTKITDNSRIQIMNYTGQVLYENSNFIGETIDTRHLSNGIYLLKYSETKNFSIKRFIVQH
jgi:hypothetical protein